MLSKACISTLPPYSLYSTVLSKPRHTLLNRTGNMSPPCPTPSAPGLSLASLEIRAFDEPEPPSLRSLPTELLIKIFSELPIKDAFHLAQTNRNLHGIYKEHAMQILKPIFTREFGPLEPLLRIAANSCADVDPPFETWLSFPISFGGKSISNDPEHSNLPRVRFGKEHIPNIMEVVKAVSQWELAIPRLRFAKVTVERRSLRPHEKERFRRALYTLWRYSNTYHKHFDDHDVREDWFRSREFRELRANSLRALSTAELHELKDLWETIRSAVTTQLCPSYSLLLDTEARPRFPSVRIHSNLIQGNWISDQDLDERSWGDEPGYSFIIGNVLRLAPDQLITLLDHIAAYPTAKKITLRKWFRSLHPTYDRALETLSDTLDAVLAERLSTVQEEMRPELMRFWEVNRFPNPSGGILDGQWYGAGSPGWLRAVLYGETEEEEEDGDADNWPASEAGGDEGDWTVVGEEEQEEESY
ncbi:hypothetical protein GE09DRAFT_1070180 [Coniochaeta sp. 2T2.1]|nr:hypothetical protein GE09DRAFT_1070180 [Coniochaeta sp. 2T2.1]